MPKTPIKKVAKDFQSVYVAAIADGVLTKRGAVLYLGDEPISPDKLILLQDEVKYLKNTMIWSIFQNTLAEIVRKVVFNESKDWNDVLTGKLMLFNLSQQKEIMDKILAAK